MMFCIINKQSKESIAISHEEVTIIGRGKFGIDDKRISKHHGELSVGDNGIKIKSCHKNPIYYKKSSSSGGIEILNKDELEVVLLDNDAFLLLPDSHEFIIKINTDNNQQATSSTFRIRDITEINENLENGGMALTLSQHLREEDIAVEETNQDAQEAPSSSLDTRKRSHDESEKNTEIEAKKLKTSEEQPASTTEDITPAPQTSSTTDTSINPTEIKIKPDPDSTNSSEAGSCSTSTPSVTNIKQEPDSSTVKKESDSCTPATPTIRPSCDHGVRCFRHSVEHRQNFAHPGENDYRRPDFPPAIPNSPRCPFWENCYRRNPDHFRTFEHPSATVYNPTPTLAPAQPRQATINVNVNYYNDDDEDDEEEEDFDNDDSDADRDFIVADDGIEEDDDEQVDEEEDNLEE